MEGESAVEAVHGVELARAKAEKREPGAEVKASAEAMRADTRSSSMPSTRRRAASWTRLSPWKRPATCLPFLLGRPAGIPGRTLAICAGTAVRSEE